MFELGGVTVTWGMVVLTLALVATAILTAWRRPRAVAVLAVLITAVHAVAYGTAYLDTARLVNARGTAVELAIDAFLAAASALDTAFAATGRAIGWAIDRLADVSMPEVASLSVLEFGTFLLSVAIVSALVCGALVGIVRSTDGAPLGGWLAALGVVFGAAGIVWTWLPVGVAELTGLQGLLIASAVGMGYAIAAVATGASPTLVIRDRMRAYR